MPPYTGLIWHYTFIKKKKKKKFFFFFFYIKCMSLHILATQFLRKTTNSPNLVVRKSWYLYTFDHWEGFWKVIHWNAACWYKQQTLAQIVLQATLHTIFEICHPILLFGTILLLNLCDLPPYTLIWHYTFIRHTRVVLFIDGLILSLKNLFFVVLLLPCGPSIHVEMPMKVGVVLCGPFHWLSVVLKSPLQSKT